jgi:uncharacterized membrane protein
MTLALALLAVIGFLPIVALVLALSNRERLNEIGKQVARQSAQIEGLRVALRDLQKRIEAGGGLEPDRAAALRAAAEPTIAPPTPATAEPRITPAEAPPPPAAGPRTAPTTPASPAAPGPRVPSRPAYAGPGPVPTAPTPPASPTARTSSPSVALFEREFGGRLAVWLGAIALALAGAFLVKYSIDQGWLGPTARVALGFAFGAGLLLFSQWVASRSAQIAQGCAASGVAVLYAVNLAAVNLYHLIPTLPGFLVMAAITAGAVLLSLRHGQLVAVLGLLGGFFTPVWIGASEQAPWQLLAYLLLLQAALLFVSRRRGWWPVGALTVAGTFAWGLLWIAERHALGGGTTAVGSLALLSTLSAVLAASAEGGRWDSPTAARRLSWAAAGAGLVMVGVVVPAGDFGWSEWVMLALIGAGAIALARIDPPSEGLAWVATLLPAALHYGWGIEVAADGHRRFWCVALVFAMLYGVGAYAAAWRSAVPWRWMALSGVAGVAYLLSAYSGLQHAPWPVAWGVQALVLGTLYAALAAPVLRRRETLGDESLAALAVASTVLFSLAVPFELERAWLTVAWAVEIPLVAWISTWLRLPRLSALVWPLGGLVAIRLLLNPAVLRYPIGEGPVLNWLLYGYGVSIVAFVAGAVLLTRLGQSLPAAGLEAGAVLLGFAWLTLEVRQVFHPGQLDTLSFPVGEWGAFTVTWMLYGMGIVALGDRADRPLTRQVGVAAVVLGLGQGLLAQGWLANPLWSARPVGATPVINLLLFAYGLPALLAAIAARVLRFRVGSPLAPVAAVTALLFVFLTVTLEVRQAFHGTLLHGGTTTNAETYSYSLAWVLLGTALLVGAILTRGSVMRFGSAIVMLLAVGKVFLIDTAHLAGLYRVFSLLGLGTSLMLLAYLYQRFVFTDRARGPLGRAAPR